MKNSSVVILGVVLSAGVAIQDLTCLTMALAQEEIATPASHPKLTTQVSAEEFDHESNLTSFDVVWQTVKNVHWDQEVVGKKWDAFRDKYKAIAETATSKEEIRKVIQQLLSELEQSHFSIIPEESYDTLNTQAAGYATAGFTCRAIGDEAIVTKVVANSSAAKAGIVPGWVLLSFNDQQVLDLFDQVRLASKGPTRFESLAGVTLDKSLTGRPGDKLKLVMTNVKGVQEEICIELSEVDGNVAKFGNLPPMKVTFESATLKGKIGYFAFNLFLDPVAIMPAYRKAVHSFENSNGVIIDLRGNIGGIGAMTMGMASELSSKKSKLGTMTTKGGSLDFVVNESPDPVNCPVAILIDEVSMSSSEVFAGGLQDMQIAKVFGTRSAGQALPAVVTKLPNGDGFMYAIANFHSASGKQLEMEGVVPDYPVRLSKELLIQNPDPVLSRAIDWINSENSKKNSKKVKAKR